MFFNSVLDYEGVVFKNAAGLGDSANALSAAFLYSVRAGKMFFVDWKPWQWENIQTRDISLGTFFAKLLSLV